jgi:hypothetical protein
LVKEIFNEYEGHSMCILRILAQSGSSIFSNCGTSSLL